MIIVSNHVKEAIKLPEDAVIRINAAWVSSIAELEFIIQDNQKHYIYLDYPEGRTKPPKPVLSFLDVVEVAKKYNNIKYFAVSNAEEEVAMRQVRNILPSHIKIVPKIETPRGVINLVAVVHGADTEIVMLDKEDLYCAVNKDTLLFTFFIDYLRSKCREFNVKVLELQGVIFHDE